MRILILTGGSRGDVEPFAALARAAVHRGHTVRLGVPDNSGTDLSGIDVESLRIDFAALIPSNDPSPLRAARALRTTIRPAMKRFLAAAVRVALAFHPDLIVYHPKVLSAPLVADALGVPHVLVEMVPSMTPTRAFPAPGVASVSLGPLNPATYAVVRSAAAMFSGEVAAVRTLLPRPSRSRATPPAATLIPISPELLPRPSDWPASVHLTGAWHQEMSGQQLAPAVEQFLDQGPFVYAGFGSMVAGDPAARAAIIIDAARKRELRVLAVEGWGGLRVPDSHHGDDVLAVATVPHGPVLPRATVAIHHGGAGTVHAVAGSGVPSIVVPFLADQPFWGRRLFELGLAPRPIPQKKLTPSRMDGALTASVTCRDEAERIGDRIRSEEGGTKRALLILESLLR